jgi:hypothetical protein
MLFNKGISNAEEEGSFTKEGGGYENFQDRVQSQREIKIYLNEIFSFLKVFGS